MNKNQILIGADYGDTRQAFKGVVGTVQEVKKDGQVEVTIHTIPEEVRDYVDYKTYSFSSRFFKHHYTLAHSKQVTEISKNYDI